MSMNQYMHPRNIYKSPPDFKQLAIEYPQFRKHVKQDVTGKITIDFKDVNALRALTCTLLKKDFDLEVEIPADKLIPTVPLRLNYVLWVEDLLSIAEREQDIKGIDIGAGASCIYSLLAAKKYGWMMLATEINEESIKCAQENIRRNSLDSLITVKQVKSDALLLEAIRDSEEQYDFCMCNPPFFSSQHELHPFFKSRKESRPRPRNAFCASLGEVVSKGGEVEFITKIINDSKILKEKIRIYSTMIGHKASLLPLKKLLRETDVVSFKQTEFCQGNTTRWGLAWTFCDIDLRKVPELTVKVSRKQKTKVPFKYVLPTKETDSSDVKKVSEKLETLLDGLLIDHEQIKNTKNIAAYNIISTKNTWSNQRRKRREEKKLSVLVEEGNSATEKITPTCSCDNSMEIDKDSSLEKDTWNSQKICTCKNETSARTTTPDLENALNMLAEVQVNGSPSSSKRELEDDSDHYYQNKKSKTANGEICRCHNMGEFYLKAMLVVRYEGNADICIELSWLDGTENREVLHQIMQYIKNNLKLVNE